jgi:hypothetical protein
LYSRLKGFWMAYNNDNSPSVNGLNVGTSWNNKAAYLGRGWYGGQFMPGRIDVTAGSAALYVSYAGEVKLTVDTEYWVVPDGCSCNFVPPSKAIYSNGLVLNPEPSYRFTPGLVSVGTTGQIAVSKVRSADFTQWYSTSGGESSSAATSVLVCETTGPVNVKPTIAYATKSCGEIK